MNDTLLEQLLNEGESSSLDYKRDQYLFEGATDAEKSELLKDILAFANGWRRTDGYILIGVDEVVGGRSIVRGVTSHLAESNLQQFVNTKTNRPVSFSYRAYTFENEQIGVITIPQQQRPVYLTKGFGKLSASTVYYRLGTTTAIANPDEVVRMGSRDALEQASLTVEFSDAVNDVSLGTELNWSIEICDLPEKKAIPTVKDHEESQWGPLRGAFHFTNFSTAVGMSIPNDQYFRERATYERFQRTFRVLRFVVSNIGSMAATDVRIEMHVPRGQPVAILSQSKYPEKPIRHRSNLGIASIQKLNVTPFFKHDGLLRITDREDHYKLEIDCGALQPGRKIWSDQLYIGIFKTGEINLPGTLMAANLASPQDFILRIRADVTTVKLSVEDVLNLPDLP